MLVSKCPMRISLAGGSTDLEPFLREYGRGTVVSFSSSVCCYITLHTDRLGLNGCDKKYVIDYMKREVVDHVPNIKNNVAREALLEMRSPPTTVWFTSDIYTTGSGLASSSAYMTAMLNALLGEAGKRVEKIELCKLSIKVERKFNPLLGYQDTYGCALGGLNRLDFDSDGNVTVSQLQSDFLTDYDMHLVGTGIARSSTEVLSSVDPRKSFHLLQIAEQTHKSIEQKDGNSFTQLVKEGWQKKKETSPLIVENSRVRELDDLLASTHEVIAHRLIGAGNGGYFLVFSKRDDSAKAVDKLPNAVKITVNESGAECVRI